MYICTYIYIERDIYVHIYIYLSIYITIYIWAIYSEPFLSSESVCPLACFLFLYLFSIQTWVAEPVDLFRFFLIKLLFLTSCVFFFPSLFSSTFYNGHKGLYRTKGQRAPRMNHNKPVQVLPCVSTRGSSLTPHSVDLLVKMLSFIKNIIKYLEWKYQLLISAEKY